MFVFQCYHGPVGHVLKTEKAGTVVCEQQYSCQQMRWFVRLLYDSLVCHQHLLFQSPTGMLCYAGGDTFLQICLWEAGHAVTSPGAGFYDWQMRSFDAGSEDRMGLVDYIMRAIEGTCHDRGLCNVSHSLV